MKIWFKAKMHFLPTYYVLIIPSQIHLKIQRSSPKLTRNRYPSKQSEMWSHKLLLTKRWSFNFSDKFCLRSSRKRILPWNVSISEELLLNELPGIEQNKITLTQKCSLDVARDCWLVEEAGAAFPRLFWTIWILNLICYAFQYAKIFFQK